MNPVEYATKKWPTFDVYYYGDSAKGRTRLFPNAGLRGKSFCVNRAKMLSTIATVGTLAVVGRTAKARSSTRSGES